MDSYKGRFQYQNFFVTVITYILMGAIHMHSARATSPTTIKPQPLTTAVLNSQSPNTFGEFCNSMVKCKAQSWLSCRPVTIQADEPPRSECACWDKDSMIYEETVGKCVSKAGEVCKFLVENPLDNTVTSLLTPCVSGANCHPVDGICMCDSKHYENINGRCLVGQSIYKPCSPPSLQCSRHEGLHCNATNGEEQIRVCTCDNTVAEYFFDTEKPEESQCVGRAEFPCINEKCVFNAECTYVEHNGVCRCKSNSYMDDERICQIKKGFSEACSKDEECGRLINAHLICHDGHCDCNTSISQHGKALLHMNYHGWEITGSELSTQCVGLVGSPCQNSRCVPNAYCRYDRDNLRGACKCESGYFKSATGRCPGGYDGICSQKEDCIDGLFCSQGRCMCHLENQNYDPRTKACHSKVDGPCNDTVNCTENAECTQFIIPKSSGNKTKFGICKCKPGFVESADGECEVKFGQPCSMFGSNCEAAANLKCIDKTCQCKTFSQYNEERGACLISVGGKCKLDDGMQSSCVIHATCVGKPNNTVGYGLYGNCQCNAGYEVTLSYTCEPSCEP